MTVHKKESTRAKSKIILPQKPSTTLLQKNKKNTKIINKTDKIKSNLYKKNRLNTISSSLKIKNISTIQYKVHITHKKTFNKA